MLAALGQEFPRLEQMPIGTIPKDMRDRTPELQHAPVFKLQGNDEAVLLGDRVASFNATRPYPGWSRFRVRAMQVASALKDSGHVAKLDRYSLKYVNIVGSSTASPTAPFNLQVAAGSRKFSANGFRLRFETEINGFLNIVELASNATIAVGTKTLSGTMITIDTIMESAAVQFWGDLEQCLNDTHDVLETLFFELLTKEAISAMGPSYDQRDEDKQHDC